MRTAETPQFVFQKGQTQRKSAYQAGDKFKGVIHIRRKTAIETIYTRWVAEKSKIKTETEIESINQLLENTNSL